MATCKTNINVSSRPVPIVHFIRIYGYLLFALYHLKDQRHKLNARRDEWHCPAQRLHHHSQRGGRPPRLSTDLTRCQLYSRQYLLLEVAARSSYSPAMLMIRENVLYLKPPMMSTVVERSLDFHPLNTYDKTVS